MEQINEAKVNLVQKELLEWYSQYGRKFPWRENNLTEYQLIIAETLLQRTQAGTVSRFYQNFIQDFPNWKALSLADDNKLENYLKPIGLYTQRAKRLKNLAQEMIKRNEIIPRSRIGLESIPFFGQYIANAVELLILNNPKPLLDVNMARVLERIFGERRLVDIRYDPYLQNLAIKIVSIPEAKEINWAILDFATLVCKSKKPLCETCILNNNCNYYLNIK